MRFIAQPNADFRLGDFLRENLRNADWTRFRAAIAFVKRSGAKHLKDDLTAFAKRAAVKISIGVDLGGTSQEGLEDLLAAVGSTGQLYIVHNEQESTFHPKIYLFAREAAATLAIGSGNLTQGGLFTNYESMLALELDLEDTDDQDALLRVEAALDEWTNTSAPTVRKLDAQLLKDLIQQGYVKTEARAIADEPVDRPHPSGGPPTPPLFPRVAVKRAPSVKGHSKAAPQPKPQAQVTQAKSIGFEGFVMTLMQGDAGHGQTTPGKSRRSPEIFIPLAARDYAPAFWGWPDQFQESPKQWDRKGVRVRIGTEVVVANIMLDKLKKGFRLRSERLRSAGSVGDIMKLVKADPERVGYSYDFEIIKQGSPAFASYLSLCTHEVASAKKDKKRWGHY